MRRHGQDLPALRDKLKRMTVYLIPYCHADIAWMHSRLWHVNRYVRALDEALDLLDRGPSFRYFVDSWTEMLRPYLLARPHQHARLAAQVRDGRLAICGGHWGNLRMTQVGDETIVRHLVMGPRRVREAIPGFEPATYANMDVAIGHTQVPQLLRLAGFAHYMAWRPSAALDAQGVPRAFVWEGLSGHRIPVYRVCYAALNRTPEGTWDEDWDASLRLLGSDIEVAAAQEGVSAAAQFVGMDDTRPLKTHADDAPCRTDELIRAWNAAGMGRMRYGTPDELFGHLRQDALPTVNGVLDEAEVCYNLNWMGHRSLAWWREEVDRLLVEAATWDALASLRGTVSREPVLRDAWEKLLDVTPHAQQMLFVEDEEDRFHLAVEARRAARQVRQGALAALLPACLPLDATHLAVVNPLPYAGRRLVRGPVRNSDRSMRSFAILDEDGREVPAQVTDPIEAHDEFEVEFLMDLPACGARPCRVEWRRTPLPPTTGTSLPARARVEHGRLALRFDAGHLVSIEDAVAGRTWDAGEGRSFALPTVLPYESGTWLPEGLHPSPVPTEARDLALAQHGPILARVERVVSAGDDLFRQTFDLYGDLGEVRVTTNALLRREGVFAGVSLPVPDGADLRVDIPFGVEPRDPANVPYGTLTDVAHENFERRIPGYFWGRSWVDVAGPGGGVALIAEDGDRFYWLHPSGRWLVHFLKRVPHPATGAWEA